MKFDVPGRSKISGAEITSRGKEVTNRGRDYKSGQNIRHYTISGNLIFIEASKSLVIFLLYYCINRFMRQIFISPLLDALNKIKRIPT